MNVLLFEWLTGGGLYCNDISPNAAEDMLAMGSAMVLSVASDLAEFATVQLIWDERVGKPPESSAGSSNKPRGKIEVESVSGKSKVRPTVRRLADEADVVLVIAPETGGCLAEVLNWLGESGRQKLISPNAKFVGLTSDKNNLAVGLRAAGFPHSPTGSSLAEFIAMNRTKQEELLPAVLKPADGAGSEGVRFVESCESLERQLAEHSIARNSDSFRIEQFIAGTPASVSVIGSEGKQNEIMILKPLRQVFDSVPFGGFVRSADDLTDRQIERATKLVIELTKALPRTAGFFGVDVVLSDTNALHDAVIEVNPRLTMSYVKLRAIYSGNLGSEMVTRANVAVSLDRS